MSSNLKKTHLSSHLERTIHDLNNIFTSTINSTEILENLISENEDVAKLVSVIKTNSYRAIDIVNALENDSVKQKRKIAIIDIVKDVEATIKITLPQNIKFEIEFGENLNKIFANYTDIYRVFLNLVVNAFESIDESGSIFFSIKNSEKKDALFISIKDTGLGISAENIKNIFNDGYSTKNKNSNSGLGLSIVKNIVNEHGGTIEVNSKVNSGTEFVVTLPSAKADKEIKGFSKILLADDDSKILELFSDLLKSYNYEVVTASNGKSTLAKFNEDSFDLIIIDKTMPKIDGVECIKQIRKRDLVVPIILMTGSQEVIDKDYPGLNINRKIKKPWDFENMLEVIQKLLQ